VRLLRGLVEEDPAYPRVVFVHQGTLEEGEAFFAKRWPAAAAVADPERRLFEAFSLGRGSLGQLLGPRVLASGLRATLRGNLSGKPVGDVRQMPGAFVVHKGRVLWSHASRHAGDQPDYRRIPALLPRT
jgi:hypothetical protein